MRGNLPVFIKNFLSSRYFKVLVGSTLSDEFVQEQGVPQGSVLSVSLFIISIDDILLEIPPCVKGTLYVDDLHISCEAADMRFIERQLQTAVNKIIRWSNENGFSFSPSKTNCVHFCRKRALHPDPEIQLAGNNIKVVQEIKFLGIIFDNKLTFRSHVLYLRKKCERSANILKILSNTFWGADRTSLLKIYRSVVRSKLDYGCMVYGSACKSTLQKLNTVHHLALRLCSGAFRTSPVQSLYVDCYEMPLDLRRESLSLQYYFRTSSHRNHPFHGYNDTPFISRLYQSRPNSIPHFHRRAQNILSNLTESVDILPTFTHCPPWENSSFTFLNPFNSFDKGSTPDIVYQQLFKSHRKSYESFTPVFTDGSKSEDFVGSAYVIDTNTYSYRLHSAFSVFSAEIFAIHQVLGHLTHAEERSFIIYTDSFSVLQSLSSSNHRSHPLVPKILYLYNKLISEGFSILFSWVPSHVGITGNELADKAAKSATDYFPFPLPYCDAKIFANSLLQLKWQNSWDTCVSNKLHAIKPSIKNWSPQPSRKYDVIITRLRIGHTRLTHRYLLFAENIPICQRCQVLLSVKHILVECPNFIHHRAHHFRSHSFTLEQLLGEIPHRGLLNFIKHIGFYPHI